MVVYHCSNLNNNDISFSRNQETMSSNVHKVLIRTWHQLLKCLIFKHPLPTTELVTGNRKENISQHARTENKVGHLRLVKFFFSSFPNRTMRNWALAKHTISVRRSHHIARRHWEHSEWTSRIRYHHCTQTIKKFPFPSVCGATALPSTTLIPYPKIPSLPSISW